MGFLHSFSLFLAIWAISLLNVARSQVVKPSNDPLYAVRPWERLSLTPPQVGMVTSYDIRLASSLHANTSAPPPELRKVNVTGTLVLTTPDNVGNLSAGNLACISCDPSSAQDTIKAAIQRVAPDNPSDGGIVLYTTTSDWCNYDQPSDLKYDRIFSLDQRNSSQVLESWLQRSRGTPTQSSTIMLQSRPDASNPSSTSPPTASPTPTQANGSSPNDSITASPTTTVAMIILYSITGIITILFIVIIVTGAIRAHRHPDRYGPMNVIGRPRQSRARGIARAMLDTLPIVKFGEREADKDEASSSGIELSRARTHPSPHSEAMEDQRPMSARSVPANVAMSSDERLPSAEGSSVTAAAATPSQQDEISPEAQAEAGLACSVCTDDFIKGQDTRVLPCNHKFHPECIDPWLLNVSGTCPLCRVDLRPPGWDSEDLQSPTTDGANPQPTSRNTSTVVTDPYPLPSLAPPGRRTDRTSGTLSTYLHRALNIGHMREATPQQRVEALRDLRNARRQTGDVPEERTRDRVSRRWSRMMGRDVTPAPDLEAGTSTEVPSAVPQTATATSSTTPPSTATHQREPSAALRPADGASDGPSSANPSERAAQ